MTSNVVASDQSALRWATQMIPAATILSQSAVNSAHVLGSGVGPSCPLVEHVGLRRRVGRDKADRQQEQGRSNGTVPQCPHCTSSVAALVYASVPSLR